MWASFFLSAFRLATVHSFSRSVRSESTSSSSVGASVAATTFELALALALALTTDEFALVLALDSRLAFEYRGVLALTFELFSRSRAVLIILGMTSPAAIP